MYTHLKDRQQYVDRYDHTTVFLARLDLKPFLKLRDKWFEKMPDNEENEFRNSFHLNNLYMLMVGNRLVDRYNERNQSVAQMMAEDEARDNRIASARLTLEPVCKHCGKTGLRLTDRMFTHGRNGPDNHEEDVLFMLKCSHCEKNTATWEDGVVWELPPTKCPKCQAYMGSKDSRRGEVITTTYTCPNCQHTYKDKLDLHHEEEPVDPDYEEDRRLFCLQDEKSLLDHRDAKHRLEELKRFQDEWQEKEDNKELYDALKGIKKPKIAEIVLLLQPALEKAGYSEFSLDKPEIGKDVFVGFNCLDTKSDRNDYDSQKTLEKLIKKALEPTNWRLMTDGIRYRLGYLSGRIRAYEREEDLKQLVMKSRKLKLKPKRQADKPSKKNPYNLEGKNGEIIIL